MGTKRHNPGQIIFAWAGLNIRGYAAEGFITINRTSEATQSSVGANAEVTVEVIPDDRKRITLRLQRSSDDNKALTKIFQAQRTSGDVFFSPLLIEDPNVGDKHVAPTCWIMDEPDPEYSAQVGISEWVFEAANMQSFHGGV